jgi:ADP-ribose pyrophosphatase YjhB (NUDIX family)
MADLRTLLKVTALITRPGNNRPELLLLRHPNAGIQLPSGTVEWDETVEMGLLREVREETGLVEVQLIGRLAVLDEKLPDDERAVLRLTKVFDEPASDASSAGHGLQRGAIVRVEGQAGKFSAVTYEWLDLDHDPPMRRGPFSGYVRRSLLTDRLERHFFHLVGGASTADTWPISTDGHIFQLFWTPLEPQPQLNPYQSRWLATLYPDLLASVRANR